MTKHIRRSLGVALLLGAAATSAWAGGPNYTFDYANRIPYVWHPENWPGGAVPVYTDLPSHHQQPRQPARGGRVGTVERRPHGDLPGAGDG
jgi:hypothetical protein